MNHPTSAVPRADWPYDTPVEQPNLDAGDVAVRGLPGGRSDFPSTTTAHQPTSTPSPRARSLPYVTVADVTLDGLLDVITVVPHRGR